MFQTPGLAGGRSRRAGRKDMPKRTLEFQKAVLKPGQQVITAADIKMAADKRLRNQAMNAMVN